MNSKGMVCVHFRGQDFVTFDHTHDNPRQFGARLAQVALTCFQKVEVTPAAPARVAPLRARNSPKGARASRMGGEAFLAAIARGETAQAVAGDSLYLEAVDCQYALMLNLDEGVFEFWDLSDRIESFLLPTLRPGPLEGVGLRKEGHRTDVSTRAGKVIRKV